MAIPDPQLGLVLSYAYLWHHEHRAGRDEGIKNRPCIIVLAIEHPADESKTLVRVAPVTHTPPDNPVTAIELPPAVKRHLGLDSERSWVIFDEVNSFAWPGFDLRPLPHSPEAFSYGFLPPRLFSQLMSKLTDVWSKGLGKSIPRD